MKVGGIPVALLLFWVAQAVAAGLAIEVPAPDLRGIAVTPAGLNRLLTFPGEPAGVLAVSTRRARGGAHLFEKMMPSVVVVRVGNGHGTGFFISDDGLVLTNHHVIASGLEHSLEHQASFAMLHRGRLEDGLPVLLDHSTRAYLLKTDPSRDLALLRLESNGEQTPYLELAANAPTPGLGCAALGHPSSGMLWTFRDGRVASIGESPRDMVDVVLARAAVGREDRARLEAAISRMPSRKIIVSTIGVNPGDSGGPIVDEEGRVIAVTFAIPANLRDDKFAYHVHLDEVRGFLADVPPSPIVLEPDPWEMPPEFEIADVDGDRVPDLLRSSGDELPDTLMFDLDNDTPRDLFNEENGHRLVAEKAWDFEVAIRQRRDELVVFYDTDNDGSVDLILVSSAGSKTAGRRFGLAAQGWKYDEPAATPVLDAGHLKAPALAARLRQLTGVERPPSSGEPLRRALEKNKGPTSGR